MREILCLIAAIGAMALSLPEADIQKSSTNPYRVSIYEETLRAEREKEVELVNTVVKQNESMIMDFIIKDPQEMKWINISLFDFTNDGEMEVILSKSYLNFYTVVTYIDVYDQSGNKLFGVLGGNGLDTNRIYVEEETDSFYFYTQFHWGADNDMNLYSKIRKRENWEEESVVLEWETRGAYEQKQNEEIGYDILDITTEDREKLWENVYEEMVKIRDEKNADVEKKKFKEYKQYIEGLEKKEMDSLGCIYCMDDQVIMEIRGTSNILCSGCGNVNPEEQGGVSIDQIGIQGRTEEETKLIQKILSADKEEFQEFLTTDWEFPYEQEAIMITAYDFTGDGRDEIIVSKFYVNISAPISYNFVYNWNGERVLEFVGGHPLDLQIIANRGEEGTFLLYHGNHYSSHNNANIYTEIKWKEDRITEEVILMELDRREGGAEGKEEYYIFKNFTKEEEEKLWRGASGVNELTKTKEYVREDEKLEEYRQLFEESKATEVSMISVILYSDSDGGFIEYVEGEKATVQTGR